VKVHAYTYILQAFKDRWQYRILIPKIRDTWNKLHHCPGYFPRGIGREEEEPY
jgi:hypothetical protein